MPLTLKCLLPALLITLATPGYVGASMLENNHWQIDVQPETLAIQVTLKYDTIAPAPRIQVSEGLEPRRVSNVLVGTDRLSWAWNEGAYQVAVELHDKDLQVRITALEPSEMLFLQQPAAAMGQGLTLPLAEGSYVPHGDARWQNFLTHQMNNLDTTQDLSLPLWGMDYGTFSLHWLITNPYNNRLVFKAQDSRIAIAARHEFTSLAPGAPLTFMLHLGSADPTSGAQRYRQWLFDAGQYQSLSSKITELPAAAKLLGAGHAYLWGDGLIGIKDVESWPALLTLLNSAAPLAIAMRAKMNLEAITALKSNGRAMTHYQRRVLVNAFNDALNAEARSTWQIHIPDNAVLASAYGELRAKVQKLFGKALANDPAAWGDTLSLQTLEKLQAAGLGPLWLGLGAGWEGGLWHPEVIARAIADGHLIGPYDSYETALPIGTQPDWATAHLGEYALLHCALLNRDGKPVPGFQKSGVYTNPQCMKGLLEERVKAVQAKTGFNSWFLDVYGAGMLFDDYRTTASMTMAQNAAANTDVAGWFGKQHWVVGTESGNATTATGWLFAHGQQTPVFGWGDKVLSDPASPGFLGSWYPGHQPAIFFKPVTLGEPYRSLYFAAPSRLPLYQTVFHGSLISSHHWSYDNLKLTNVAVQNHLAQLLYNVAPMFHLSNETLDRRLPAIQQMNSFFRPLHERLGTQTMTAFRWLSEDRQLQETRFEDGTRMVANFTDQEQVIDENVFPPHSVIALNPDNSRAIYTARPLSTP